MKLQDHGSKIDLEIKRAAQLSVTEICIGSLGHGFKIPLTGQILSLNQLAFLLNALNADHLPKSAVFEISGIAAVLKSLSPAGQKLGPMLSISTQGFLFWLSVTLFGTNFLGQILGAILLSLWAFIQPFITLFLIYGFDIVELVNHYLQRLTDDYSFIALSLLFAVTLLLILKLSVAIGFVAYSIGKNQQISLIGENRISNSLMRQIPNGRQKDPFKSALKDMLKPLFLISFVLMVVFVWQAEGPVSRKIWLSLRPLASAFVLFYLLRSEWVAQKLFHFSKKSKIFSRIYSKSKSAMEIVNAKIKQQD